jgi:hypothetical protein
MDGKYEPRDDRSCDERSHSNHEAQTTHGEDRCAGALQQNEKEAGDASKP